MEIDQPPLSPWSQLGERPPPWRRHEEQRGDRELSSNDGNSSPLWLAYRILYPLCICLVNFSLAIGAWLLLLHPLRLYRLLRWLRARRCGLRFRQVTLDGAAYRFAEKGRPDPLRPSLLLIHGVADECTVWAELARLADSSLDHVIAVDLPGHGGSEVSADEDFSLAALAVRLRAVLAAAGHASLRLHAVGCSSGAGVAMALAVGWPDQTELLTLVAPLLLSPPRLTTATDKSCSGRNADDETEELHESSSPEILNRSYDSDLYNWLLPWNPTMVSESMRRRFYRPVALTGGCWPSGSPWLAERLSQLAFHRALLASLAEEPGRSELLSMASRVRAPTQIVWGVQDEISPICGAEQFRSRLANLTQFDTVDECGHSPEAECPAVLYNLVYKFRKNMSLKKFN